MEIGIDSFWILGMFRWYVVWYGHWHHRWRYHAACVQGVSFLCMNFAKHGDNRLKQRVWHIL